MDAHLQLFFWVLAGAGFFALLGGVFGATAGAVNWSKGHGGGTGVGLAVLGAFVRLAERDLRPGERGAIVGGADGVVFGAVLGTLIGLFAGWSPPARGAQALGPAAVAGVLLVGGAVLFGGLAWAVAWAGVRAVVALFAGGMLGALVGLTCAGTDGLFFGTAGGAVLGALAFVVPALLVNRRRDRRRDP